VNVFYKENYKLLKKEINEYRMWKDLPCSWISRINIVKMAVLPKAIYMFNVILFKITMTSIMKTKKLILNFIWKYKRPQIAKAILSKKSNSGGIIILDFKVYYIALAIKTTWYWHEDHWNRSPRYESMLQSPPNFWKRCQKYKMEKRQPLQ
jgi:hypothetical protein